MANDTDGLLTAQKADIESLKARLTTLESAIINNANINTIQTNPTLQSPKNASSLADNDLISKAQTLQFVNSLERFRGFFQKEGKILLRDDGTGDFDNMQDFLSFYEKNYISIIQTLSGSRLTSMFVNGKGTFEWNKGFSIQAPLSICGDTKDIVNDTFDTNNSSLKFILNGEYNNKIFVFGSGCALLGCALKGSFITTGYGNFLFQNCAFFKGDNENYNNINVLSSVMVCLISVLSDIAIESNRGFLSAFIEKIGSGLVSHLNTNNTPFFRLISNAFASIRFSNINGLKVDNKANVTSGEINSYGALAFFK